MTTEIVRSRQLREGRRLVQTWCAHCNSTRWVPSGEQGGCPCAAPRGEAAKGGKNDRHRHGATRPPETTEAAKGPAPADQEGQAMTATLADLLSAIRGAPNLERGLCVGQWDLWDSADDPIMTARAVSLCWECPVLPQCGEWAAGLTNRELSGVVAGVVRPWEPRSTRRRAAS
jgi:hypothetical protein